MINRYLTSVTTILIVFVLATGTAVLADDDLSFSQTPYESRYYRLINELRCLVCQNQALADSNAELAKDLRAKTYEMINAGASDEDIADFMIARYGDFVLSKPPLRLRTTLLWGGPFALLLIALIVFFFTVQLIS